MRNRASWRCTARGRAAMAPATMASISSHCAASSREASGTTQVATARNAGEESVIAGNVDVAPQAGNKPPRPLLDRAGPLLFQQRPLARDTPAVAAEAAVRSHDPVAGDDEPRGARHPLPPSARTTRWQGMTSAAGFVAQARATARVADGLPMARAMSV